MGFNPDHDCGHTCCDTRHDPFHDHFLSVEQCPSCKRDADQLASLESEAKDLISKIEAKENAS